MIWYVCGQVIWVNWPFNLLTVRFYRDVLIRSPLALFSCLQCVCAPGWTGEFCQFVGDACAIKPNTCLNGATCVTTSQPSSPPQFTCVCPPGFSGEESVPRCLLFAPFHLFLCLKIWMDLYRLPRRFGQRVWTDTLFFGRINFIFHISYQISLNFNVKIYEAFTAHISFSQ